MELLTIFTPTYNREKKLYDTFISLQKQKNHNFVWLIIDDGSTDNTEQNVLEWSQHCLFKIVYKKKKNGGKHTAYNYALSFLQTKYVYLSLDSDDVLYDENTIDNILNELSNLNNNEVGIVTLCTDSRNGNNNFVIKYEIDKLENRSLSYAYSHNLFRAEGRFILECDYVKKYKYPEIDGENFFTEAYTYWQMNKKVKWTNITTSYSNYLSDGLTANISKLFINNPNSWYLYNELRLKEIKVFYLKLKYYIYYISFGLLSKNKIFKSNINVFLIILLFPISILGIMYLKHKRRKL